MGKRSGSQSGSPAPKRCKADLEQRDARCAAIRVFEMVDPLSLILGYLLHPLLVMVGIRRVTADLPNFIVQDGKYNAQLIYFAACKAVDQLLCSFSLITKAARTTARSALVPVWCGFHMRPRVTPAQFTAFLHGWTPEYKRTSIVVLSGRGINLAALGKQLLKCEDSGIRVAIKQINTQPNGITLLPLSEVRKGVQEYEGQEFGKAYYLLRQAHMFRFNEYTHLLYNICIQGGHGEYYTAVTQDAKEISAYSLAVTRWLRDSSLEPITNLKREQFDRLHHAVCLDTLPFE